uniref:RRM domain-containing protein n=1 Tax=Strigamia maritima TaxID=126957 RepID=T1J9P5_STRMM
MADNSDCSVFIGNIPHDATEDQLFEIFSRIGPVVGLRFVYDNVTKQPKNYGFCHYRDPETAIRAIRDLNKFEVNGRLIFVNEATKDKKIFSTLGVDRSQQQQNNPKCSVFIGNIPHDATEEQLMEIFVQMGPVVSLKFVYDSETRKSKNFGFCAYHDEATAMKAVRCLDKHEFNGRRLRVNEATKKERGPSVDTPLRESPLEGAVDPTEYITRVVASMPPEEMIAFVMEIKELDENHPIKARKLLIDNPHLAYALLQVQVRLGMVDTQTALSMLRPATNMQVLRDLNNFDPELSNQSNQPPPVYKLQPLDVDTFASSHGRYTFDPENKDPRLRPRTQLKARRRTQNK